MLLKVRDILMRFVLRLLNYKLFKSKIDVLICNQVYGLSYAQQLKNKDIPEGGAKGVILVNSPSIPNATSKFYAIRTSIRAFTDSLLDLIVKDSIKGMVDYYKKEELIYLGPDEQVK